MSSPSAVACGCLERAELVSLHQRIVSAETLAGAQQVALEPALLARRALSRARWLAPGGEAIRAAEGRLAAYQLQVGAATSGVEVGQRFAELVHLDLERELVVGDASFVGTPEACTFSTLEIVAIVLGFILGIIPGIILLIILC